MRTQLALCLLCSLCSLFACKRGDEPTITPEPPQTDPQAPEDDGPAILSEWTDGKVQGIVTRAEESVEPPAGFTMEVMLRGGEGGRVLVQESKTLQEASPWAYEITLPQDAFDPEHAYSVSVMINDPDGQVWYASKPVQVFAVGRAPALVEIVIDPMDARAAAGH